MKVSGILMLMLFQGDILQLVKMLTYGTTESKKSLKTNPEKQINKVKQSLSKDVIRIIKLFRDRNNFKFKSFFLEIFCIDVIEPLYDESDDLFNKVFHFCKHYNDIGKS